MSPPNSSTLEYAPVGIMTIDLEGCIREVNRHCDALIRAIGVAPRQDILGSHWRTHFPHLDGSELDLAITEAAEGPVGLEVELPSFTGRGVYRVRVAKVAEDRVALYFLDLDFLLAASETLKQALGEAEDDLRELDTLRAAYPFGAIATFDRDFRYVSVSGRVWHDLGIDSDELVGKCFGDVWDEETADRMEELAGVALDGFEAVQRIPYEDRVYEVWMGPLDSAEDVGERGLLLSSDVTAEVEAQRRALMLDRATAAGELGVVMATASEEGHPIEYVNTGFEVLTGYSEKDALGRPCWFLEGEETDPDARERMIRAAEAGRPHQETIMAYRKDGSPFWDRVLVTPVSSEWGEIAKVVCIHEDVTEVRRAGIERDHQRRLADLGTLAGQIAHDFNNLLMEIRGYVTVLGEDSGMPGNESLQGIDEAVGRGATMVHDLLRYAHRPPNVMGDVAKPSSLLRDLERPIRRVLRRDIELRFRVPTTPMPLGIGAVRLEQILLNLAKNAADALDEGGRFQVSLSPGPAGFVRVRAEDDGAGMPPKVRERAFEPFFSTKGPGGTGLGLFTVKQLVEQAGGTVSLESRKGKGTTVELLLPAAELVEPGGRTDEATLESSHSLQGVRMLLADDEDGIRRTLTRLLTAQGLHVTAVEDGQEALDAFDAAESPFDVLLVDNNMPSRTGASVLNEVASAQRGNGGSGGAHLILMSGDVVGNVGEVPAATVLLPKPFQISELLEILGRLFR